LPRKAKNFFACAEGDRMLPWPIREAVLKTAATHLSAPYWAVFRTHPPTATSLPQSPAQDWK
jgi:hypothetical protein